ncbi:hypothetical protein FP2506_16749 [Fulvimarina pelagi HTCC2506]|uniref:Uncharacterized protein n=1 Tax=Fulvimarina pelagi HTCC2506 TaxID=314231 RepID=Q0G2T0_9HYPH|nr:hypothetical protein FP2506_16749 [Fulvimarina pelagi HTCC2506]
MAQAFAVIYRHPSIEHAGDTMNV